MARPRKWDELKMPDKLILVEGWARDGLTDEQIAQNLTISTTLLYEWKNDYSEFAEALKKGKEVSDYMVENALFKRALGYQYDEKTQEAVPFTTTKKVDGEPIEITEYRMDVTKVVTKEVAPDTVAQIYWLKNRRPDKWRDKPDTDEKIKRLITLLTKLNLGEDEINELMREMEVV